MKIVIIEPLGITPEKLAEATAAVKARGHEIVAYDTKEEDQDKLAERGKDADIIIIANPVSYTHLDVYKRQELDIPVTKEMQEGFAAGVALNDGVCKAAKLVILGEKTAEVTLQEGRYHQIKRMFGCFGAKVVSCLLYTSRCV